MALAAASKYPSVVVDTGEHTPLADDEVVFILRARDELSVPTIRKYLTLCSIHESPPEHIAAVEQSIDEFEAWQEANPDLVKVPD